MAENGGMPQRRIQPVATDQERRDLNRRLRLAFLQGAMAADDGPILPSGEHGLHEAELAQGPLERVELVVADPAGFAGSGRSRSSETCSKASVGRLRARLMRCAPPRPFRAMSG
jgi:uncharacterized ParB-like nuclease family protein